MRKLLRVVCAFLFLACLAPQVRASDSASEGRRSKKAWLISAAVLTAAHFFDAYSSMGRRELNPLLRGANGQFSPARAIAIKSAGVSIALGTQWLLLRHDGRGERAAIAVNLAGAAVLSATAVRNFRNPSTAAATGAP